NLRVISDITVRCRLPRPDEGLVALLESVHLGIQLLEVLKCRCQPLWVLGFETPRKKAAQPLQAVPKRKRFGSVSFAELFFKGCDAFAGDALVGGGQEIRTRSGKHRVQLVVELLALLEPQAHP